MSLNNSAKINERDLRAAIDALNDGECVAIPTETVYGLAADATNGRAVAKIFELKQRPSFNPLICHVDGVEMASEFGDLDEVALRLAKQFWPGPLTIVVPLLETSPASPLATAGLNSIGLRHPKGIASQIITELGKPLAAPSANKSGRVSPTTAKHVSEEFINTDLIILDQGQCAVGLESTIVKLADGNITILRPGAITMDMIETTVGILPSLHQSGNIEAPGMMRSHYAPESPVVLNVTDCSPDDAWLQFGNNNMRHSNSLNLSANGDLLEAAANLYGMLKELDALKAGRICVSPIPEDGIGIAINDRLRRAAAPRGVI